MKRYLFIIVPLLSVLFCSLLSFSSLDNKVNDMFLRTIPSLKEDKNVVIVKIDDISIERVGLFPWTRDIMADAIVFMKEMGAKSVLFDLNYLDNSPVIVDPDYVNVELPSYLNYGFNTIDENVSAVMDAVSEGAIARTDVQDYKYELLSINNQVKDSLSTNIAYVTRDVDNYFAQTLKFFGNSYLTVTMTYKENLENEDDVVDMSAIDMDYVEKNIALKNITASKDTKTRIAVGMQPAIDKLLHSSKSAGFVNADPDDDGYRRRIQLLMKYNDKYYGQFSFVPMLDYLGNPEIEVDDNSIVLKNIKNENYPKGEIYIPRSEDGTVLLKWPKKTFNDYSNTISAWDVIKNNEHEQALIKNLRAMQDSGFFGYWDNDETPIEKYDQATYIKELLYEGENIEDGITFDVYKEYRNAFLEYTKSFLFDGYDQAILDDVAGDDETVEYVKDFFEVTKKQFQELLDMRSYATEKLAGTFCIIGTTATSTSDIGLTTFDEKFQNVGTHATVMNMLLSNDFLDDAPFWISILIAALLSSLQSLVGKKFGPKESIFFGLGTLIVSTGFLLLFFIISHRYIGVVVPFASISVTFISLTVISLFLAMREKSFLRNAFSRYLSPEVINEIIADPSKLNLGGEKREMTALFTDIKSFSTISEKLPPVELVNMLNKYLTAMSNIILENNGTIDKYEGDAIISFFGAPLHMDNHAQLACQSAIRMKKAEAEINNELMKTGLLPFPLFTRIGINTGEMVVGNMGTSNKMDYTMIGNAVNLAARLEGVNKQYNTKGILISQDTREQCKDMFVVRPLDRVRVVGVETPLRLYELLEEKANADKKLLEMVTNWEFAIILYESRNFAEALKSFNFIVQNDPDDQVARLYKERCEGFIENPPDADWDGVFNLTKK